MKLLAVAGLLAAALIAAPASAVTILVTYTGTAYDGSDETDFFGLGNDLSAVDPDPEFTMQFTFDLDRGVQSGTSEWRERSGTSTNNPAIQSSFKLNGRTIVWGNSVGDGYDISSGYTNRYDEAEDGGPGGLDQVSSGSYDRLGNASNQDFAFSKISSSLNEIVDTLDLSSPLDYQLQPGDFSDGYFETTRYDDLSQAYTRYAYLYLTPTRVTVQQLGAVPEPATWAMLIVGFGLVGGALRSRPARSALA